MDCGKYVQGAGCGLRYKTSVTSAELSILAVNMKHKHRVKTAFLLLSLLAVVGCGSINADKYHNDSSLVKDVRLKSPEQLAYVSLSIVKTGEVKTLDAFFYSGGSWTRSRVGVHSAVLVLHPQGAFLFDTGLGNNIDAQFKQSMPFWLKPFMAYQKLDSAQIVLADEAKKNPIRKIILSHLHWDHASGIKDFPDAEVWTTREEYDRAMAEDAPEGPFIKSQYSGNKINWKFIQFKNVHYENFEQSLDVFEDGSVVLVPLPGHTVSSIGMFVNLKSGKRLFFIGDTTWALEGVQLPAHKFWISSLLVDDNKKITEQVILKVHRVLQEYPEMTIVPAHDNGVQDGIGFFPKFIR